MNLIKQMSSFLPSVKGKNIIIEGPDGSGKSTLSFSIVSHLTGYDCMHLGYIPDAYMFYRQFVEARNKLVEGRVILDRYILSNIVYNDVLQNNSGVYDQNMFYHELTAKLVMDKLLLIFCIPEDKEQYLERFKQLQQEREELVTDIRDISKIYDKYIEYYNAYKLIAPENVFIHSMDKLEEDTGEKPV